MATYSEGQRGLLKWFADTDAAIVDSISTAELATSVAEERIRQTATIAGAVAPKLDKTEAATTYAKSASSRFAPGRVWAFLGDSITVGSNASPLYSYTDVALRVVGSGRARDVAAGSVNAGKAGDTTNGMLARFDTDVAAFNPQGLHVQAGTNDATQGVPIATYIANMKAIVAKAKALGIPITIGTVPPRGTPTATDPIRVLLQTYNAWIRLWAPTAGIIVADTYNAVVDPTTGDLLTAYNSDGTHLTNAGHAQMGKAVGAAIVAAYSAQPAWFVNSVEKIGLVSNPLMAGGSGSMLPSSWLDASWYGATGTAPTLSTATDASGDLSAGKWLQVAYSAAAASTRSLSATVAGAAGAWSAGARLLICGKIQIDDVAGWQAAVSAGTASVRLNIVNTTTAANLYTVLENVDVLKPGPFATAITLPATANTLDLVLRITAPSGVQANIRLGQVQVYNLTALGITE